MAAVQGGSYRVLIDIATFTHRSFTDLPLLAAGYNGMDSADDTLNNFRIAQSFTIAFLDKHLKGKSDTILDKRHHIPGVRVDTFGSTPNAR